MASISRARRALLRSALLAPVLPLAARSEADEYASAAEALAAIDAREAEVEARLAAIVEALPAAGAFAASLRRDYARHRAARASLRKRLRLPARAAAPASAPDASLDGLQAALEGLVYTHAEGLPALEDAGAVDVLAHHMVDLSRQLTVVGLWRELEQPRG